MAGFVTIQNFVDNQKLLFLAGGSLKKLKPEI